MGRVATPGRPAHPQEGLAPIMDTAERIIDITEALIQRRGYNGFSFQDIATEIGIKKASLYYHFPSKADLGRAVIDRYRGRMRKAIIELEGGRIDHWQALGDYLGPILELGRTPELACLCGVLGGEYLGLPEGMQAEVRDYFAEHLTWLTRLLDSGRQAGAFAFEPEPLDMAKMIFSAVEGSMLIKRTSGDVHFVDDVIGVAAAMIRPLQG